MYTDVKQKRKQCNECKKKNCDQINACKKGNNVTAFSRHPNKFYLINFLREPLEFAA